MKNVFEAYEQYVKPTEPKNVVVDDGMFKVEDEKPAEVIEEVKETKPEPQPEFKYPEIDYDKLAAAMLKAQGTNTDNGDGIKAE